MAVSPRDVAVETKASMDSFGATGAKGVSALMRSTAVSATDSSQYSCAQRTPNDTQMHASIGRSINGSGSSLAASALVGLGLGTRRVARGSVAGTALECAVSGIGSASTSNTEIADGDAVGVGTLRCRGSFEYIAAYRVGP
jgi:hypothetical protein